MGICLWSSNHPKLVVDISARALSTISPAEQPLLSPRHYQHTDPDSGTQLVCDKCPAGTYVSLHCSPTAVRECSPCPEGTFTRGENGVQQCHRCRVPCPTGLIEKVPCTATQDRVCACPPDSFALGESGVQCKPYSLCPPGTRVKRRGSDREDVLCKPCTKGTFSDVESSSMKCQTHTDCQAQGLVLLTAGTRETDNVCGPPSMHPSSSIPSQLAPPPQAPHTHNTVTAVCFGMGLMASLPVQRGGVTHSGAEAVGAGVGISKGSGGGGALSSYYRPTRRGSPRPSTHRHFDINEHLPWMIVLLLLLVLVVIVVCSVKRSSRVLKKGPRQDPSSIMEKAIQKKPLAPPTQVKEKWIYYSNGQGVDILKLVSAQVGSQWIDIYQSLANATEREVAAFSNGYASDHERAYAALQHWTIRDSDANLAKLINALHRQRRIDVVEKIRYVMEDNPQPPESPGSGTGSSSGSGGGGSTGSVVGGAGGTAVEQSPVDRTKGFFPDESEPLLRCDSTSSKDSALSRTGSFITKEKKDTVLRQVRLDPCDLQPIFDDMLHILNPEELHVIEEIPAAEDKLDRLFEIAGVKSQEASQTLLDSVYSHLPDLL
uniref:Tumor necrosis factor receptor superfamily, member 21 n=1 Tax=Myripristis murdjan TaxID=586833 RepID=A0A667Y1B3_9TELE